MRINWASSMGILSRAGISAVVLVSAIGSARGALVDDLLDAPLTKTEPVETLLAQRDAIQKEFSQLPEDRKKVLYRRVVFRLNELFLVAQGRRIRDEIAAEERIAADDS